MANTEATAVTRISDSASEPRAAAKPRSPQNATMCTKGTAMATQQQKPAADKQRHERLRRDRQQRKVLGGTLARAARTTGAGRT